MKSSLQHIKALIFDLDGTLTTPGSINFSLIRSKLNIPNGEDILSFRDSKTLSLEQKNYFMNIIEQEEFKGTLNCNFNEGFNNLCHWLNLYTHKFNSYTINNRPFFGRAIITRNSNYAVESFIKKINETPNLLDPHFDPFLSRDNFPLIKPSPEPFIHICKGWKLDTSSVLMVGDSIDDVKCARSAGSLVCAVRNNNNIAVCNDADFCVNNLTELTNLLIENVNIK